MGRKKTELRTDGLKMCHKCKQLLPIDNFYADRTHSDGLKSSCKTCVPIKKTTYVRVKVRKKRSPNKTQPKVRDCYGFVNLWNSWEKEDGGALNVLQQISVSGGEAKRG